MRFNFGSRLAAITVTPAMLGKIQSWMRDPLISSVAFNLWLILLWYFFGTALSLFNKLVLCGAEGKGLFHAGRFPAPFMFTSWQLFLQVLFSKALLGTFVKRKAESKMTYVVSRAGDTARHAVA